MKIQNRPNPDSRFGRKAGNSLCTFWDPGFATPKVRELSEGLAGPFAGIGGAVLWLIRPPFACGRGVEPDGSDQGISPVF
jgi:hypothetical protein